MATIIKRIRVANPRRRRIVVRRKSKKNARGVHRSRGRLRAPRNKKGMFVKVSKRRRTHARRKTSASTRLRTVKRRANPRRRAVSRRRPRRNPVLMELGVLNPRRSTNVATKRRRRKVSRNPRRHRRHVTAVVRVRRRRRKAVNRVHRRRRTRRNPVTVVRYRRRTVNRRHHRGRGRRRNPSVFGRSGGKDLLMMTGGVLVGVAAAKMLPSMIPASITAMAGGSPVMGAVITAAGAFAAGWLARKFTPEPFSDAVMLGGLSLAASQLLNVFMPSVGGRFALSGMGDIVPGWYPVPQNPVTSRAPMAMVAAPSNGGGMGAFRSAWGRR